jgi:hypothetical protein
LLLYWQQLGFATNIHPELRTFAATAADTTQKWRCRSYKGHNLCLRLGSFLPVSPAQSLSKTPANQAQDQLVPFDSPRSEWMMFDKNHKFKADVVQESEHTNQYVLGIVSFRENHPGALCSDDHGD